MRSQAPRTARTSRSSPQASRARLPRGPRRRVTPRRARSTSRSPRLPSLRPRAPRLRPRCARATKPTWASSTVRSCSRACASAPRTTSTRCAPPRRASRVWSAPRAGATGAGRTDTPCARACFACSPYALPRIATPRAPAGRLLRRIRRVGHRRPALGPAARARGRGEHQLSGGRAAARAPTRPLARGAAGAPCRRRKLRPRRPWVIA